MGRRSPGAPETGRIRPLSCLEALRRTGVATTHRTTGWLPATYSTVSARQRQSSSVAQMSTDVPTVLKIVNVPLTSTPNTTRPM